MPHQRLTPEHIRRMEAELSPDAYSYAECGGNSSRIGEDVTMELEYAPGRFVVERIARPRLT